MQLKIDNSRNLSQGELKTATRNLIKVKVVMLKQEGSKGFDARIAFIVILVSKFMAPTSGHQFCAKIPNTSQYPNTMLENTASFRSKRTANCHYWICLEYDLRGSGNTNISAFRHKIH